MLTSLVVRQALVPMLVGYLVVMSALGFGLSRLCRRQAGDRDAGSLAGERPGMPGAPAGRRHGWLALARHVIGVVVAGYLLLMAVVLIYYYGIARVGGNFIQSAFTGTAMLIGIALPLFAVASWLTELRCRRRGGTPGHRGDSDEGDDRRAA